MTYFELLEQFWQLDAERTIAPAASKLYFYLLNAFNTPRWPAKIYRRANQVYADLSCDKKSLPVAVAILEARGLIRHYSGDNARSGEWHLNYGPAAEWAQGRGKNSPQESQNPVEVGGIIPHAIPETSQGVGNISPSIRNRPEETRPDPKKNAGVVGKAAEEITHAPLPDQPSQLVPPVAEPPHAAESRSVAAAELTAALAAEAKALANELAPTWDISEITNQPKWGRIHSFTRRMAALGRLPEVRRQFAGYLAGHMRPGVRPHQLDKWLGHREADYADGEWCGCNWPGVAAKVQARPHEVLAHATAGTTSSPTKARQAKSW